MITNTLPQYTIFEANSFPASTLDMRLVAVCGRESQAITGARSFAVAHQRTFIVQIEEGDKVRHVFVRPQEASREVSNLVAAADGFIAMREKHRQIAKGETGEPSWFCQLSYRGDRDGYGVYTGPESACKEGAKHWPGSTTRRNGANGSWLLTVPLRVAESKVA